MVFETIAYTNSAIPAQSRLYQLELVSSYRLGYNVQNVKNSLLGGNMIRIKRLTGISLVAAMMLFVIAPSAAIAVDSQYVGPPPPVPCALFFSTIDLPAGTPYDITVNGTTYNVTAQHGVINDLTLSFLSGTVINFTIQDPVLSTDIDRYHFVGSGWGLHGDFTIAGPTGVMEAFSHEGRIRFDQTGLPDDTEYWVNNGWAVGMNYLTAGTPFDVWSQMADYVESSFNYQDPVTTDFGSYPLAGVTPASPVIFTAPFNVMGTYASGSVDGSVYNDANNNGVRDRGEDGIPDATVELIGGVWNEEDRPPHIEAIPDGMNLSVFKTFTSDVNGDYSFDGVPAGTFYVRITLPNGDIQDSAPINLVIDGTGVTSGTADFPEGVAGPATLPYTGR
jgi:hypothetical protein